MSSIASKWFGEGEKYVKAIFTLASKISPVVIFIDEVDSILGKREKAGEHEAMRKMKNEFMANWDGLKTKENERVLVLAASNRPFDLDDAVLRRMARRMLIDLPNVEQRVKILKVILAKEELAPDFNFEQLALMTEGYSGSDLKNLCVAAAYNPIREFLQAEVSLQKNLVFFFWFLDCVFFGADWSFFLCVCRRKMKEKDKHQQSRSQWNCDLCVWGTLKRPRNKSVPASPRTQRPLPNSANGTSSTEREVRERRTSFPILCKLSPRSIPSEHFFSCFFFFLCISFFFFPFVFQIHLPPSFLFFISLCKVSPKIKKK
jgi:SpoVK/Ycf46/Vps4 family AAA+-type ATPase